MTYNVYIQGNLVGTLEANDTDDALRLVGQKLGSGEYSQDPALPPSIKLEPQP
jgi:hypothetical protein